MLIRSLRCVRLNLLLKSSKLLRIPALRSLLASSSLLLVPATPRVRERLRLLRSHGERSRRDGWLIVHRRSLRSLRVGTWGRRSRVLRGLIASCLVAALLHLVSTSLLLIRLLIALLASSLVPATILLISASAAATLLNAPSPRSCSSLLLPALLIEPRVPDPSPGHIALLKMTRR